MSHQGKRKRRQRYWIKDLMLYVSDRQSIVSGEWLTDAVIDCSQVLLKNQYPHVGGLQMTTLGLLLRYSIETGEFVQILNVRRSHWVTVSNIGCKPDHFNVYDSMPSGNNISLRAKQQICAMIFSNSRQIILDFPKVQCQRGASDCGLFSIAFATTLCTGFDPAEIEYNQSLFRDHLMQCIQDRKITPFPCEMKKRQQSTRQEVVKIHCQCRQPESGKMAACDGCSKWYHEECVHFPMNIEHVKWFCPNCQL